jgi:hypothetical protein
LWQPTAASPLATVPRQHEENGRAKARKKLGRLDDEAGNSNVVGIRAEVAEILAMLSLVIVMVRLCHFLNHAVHAFRRIASRLRQKSALQPSEQDIWDCRQAAALLIVPKKLKWHFFRGPLERS